MRTHVTECVGGMVMNAAFVARSKIMYHQLLKGAETYHEHSES
jgi:hypothetical protein